MDISPASTKMTTSFGCNRPKNERGKEGRECSIKPQLSEDCFCKKCEMAEELSGLYAGKYDSPKPESPEPAGSPHQCPQC